MSENIYPDSVKDLIDTAPAHKLIRKSMRILLPDKNNWFGILLSGSVGIVLSYNVGTAEDTVFMTMQLCDILLSVQLTIFGCIFAVYSILLAFLSDSYIKKLSHIGYGDGSTYLVTSTQYYESELFTYFIAIMVSLVLKLSLNCMPLNYTLTNSHFLNECLATVLLTAYITFSIRVIYELKSIIYNTIFLFRASLAYKIISFAEAEQEERQS